MNNWMIITEKDSSETASRIKSGGHTAHLKIIGENTSKGLRIYFPWDNENLAQGNEIWNSHKVYGFCFC